MPDIRTIPVVSLDSKPAPEPNTKGMIPITVEQPVIITGLNLFLQESIRDSDTFMPAFLICLANSTIRIPFFAEIHNKIINPICLKIFSEFSNRYIELKGATNVSGTDNIIINGYLKLSNCAHSIK